MKISFTDKLRVLTDSRAGREVDPDFRIKAISAATGVKNELKKAGYNPPIEVIKIEFLFTSCNDAGRWEKDDRSQAEFSILFHESFHNWWPNVTVAADEHRSVEEILKKILTELGKSLREFHTKRISESSELLTVANNIEHLLAK